MPRGVKRSAPAEPQENILAPFEKIAKGEKTRFAKTAAKMGIDQEELLSLAVRAINEKKVKFETKTAYELK